MFKAMILLKRKEEMSFAEFKNWLLIEHAPRARQLPGLKRAVFNLVAGAGDGNYDSVSELWFESEQHFIDAYASDIGQNVAADSLSKVVKRDRLLVSEHEVFAG